MSVRTATEKELMEFPFAQKSVKIGKKAFVFRELSVQENDDCYDSSKEADGRVNGRTMMRLMILASSVDPKLTLKDLTAMPQRVYAKVYETVNDLNDPETLSENEEVDDEGGND